MKFLFLLVIPFVFNAYGSLPTLESLFRGGANPDLNLKTFVVHLKVSYIFQNTTSEINGISIKNLKNEDLNHFYKLLFFVDEEGKISFLQLNYKKNFEKENLNKIIYKPRFNYVSMGFSKESLDQSAFYSILSHFYANSGSLLIETLKNNGIQIKSNKELVNKEQLKLISRYKWYLKESKDNSELKNPLTPETPEEKERLAGIMEAPFYFQEPYVLRVRGKDNFFIEVSIDDFFAKFSQKNHELLKFKLQTDFGSVEVTPKNYMVYSSNFMLPEILYVKDSRGIQYKVELQKTLLIDDTMDGFSKRYKRYLDDFAGKSSNEAFLVPSVLK